MEFNNRQRGMESLCCASNHGAVQKGVDDADYEILYGPTRA
jgi:hypothetical protein